MNWLDIILIILILICVIGGIVLFALRIKDYEVGEGIICLLLGILLAFCFALPFIVLDKARGCTVGTITSVDKNFFGTTALYIKTIENKEEVYCIEFNTKLEEQSRELIGKKVKISYGERVGLYSTGKCNQAPIEKIEIYEE